MNSSPETRIMTEADIGTGMSLCRLAGWNQLERDWQRFLALEPGGCFVASLNGGVCATVTNLAYGSRFGWLGMLLTAPETRRLGIGGLLLERGCSFLQSAGVETVKLDGTPMGRSLYLKHGFVDEYQIERWECPGMETPPPALPSMGHAELEQVCAWDLPLFGADRRFLLTRIWEENQGYSAVVRSGGEILGYTLGRAGSRAHYLGPWVARTPEAAGILLREFMARHGRTPVYLDICAPNPAARGLAESSGFRYQRSLTRMYRGPNSYPGRPELVYGIAGPELG